MRFCSIFGTLTADRTANRYSLNSVLSQQPPPFPLRSVARIAAAIFSPSSGSTAARRTSSTAFSSSAVSGRFSGESRSPSRARSSYPCVLDSSPPDPPTDPSRCRGPATPPPGSHPAGRNRISPTNSSPSASFNLRLTSSPMNCKLWAHTELRVATTSRPWRRKRGRAFLATSLPTTSSQIKAIRAWGLSPFNGECRRRSPRLSKPFSSIIRPERGSPPSPLELNSLRLRQVHVSKIPGFRSRHDRLPILQKYIHDRVASTAVQLTHHVIQEQQGIALVVLQTPSALSQEKSQNRRSLFLLGAHSTQVKLIKVKPDVVSMRTQSGKHLLPRLMVSSRASPAQKGVPLPKSLPIALGTLSVRG